MEWTLCETINMVEVLPYSNTWDTSQHSKLASQTKPCIYNVYMIVFINDLVQHTHNYRQCTIFVIYYVPDVNAIVIPKNTPDSQVACNHLHLMCTKSYNLRNCANHYALVLRFDRMPTPSNSVPPTENGTILALIPRGCRTPLPSTSIACMQVKMAYWLTKCM